MTSIFSPRLYPRRLSSAIIATESVASSLELYAQLAWLPKSREEEADDSGEAQQEEAAIPASSPGPSTPNAEGGSKAPKKPAGRLKTREKLQRIQEGGLGSALPKPTVGPNAEEAEGEEILTKKAKVDASTNDSA